MMPLVWSLQIICYVLEDAGLNVLQVIVLMSTHSYLMLSYLVGTKAEKGQNTSLRSQSWWEEERRFTPRPLGSCLFLLGEARPRLDCSWVERERPQSSL